MLILKTVLFKIETGFMNICIILVLLKVMEQWNADGRELITVIVVKFTINRWLTF